MKNGVLDGWMDGCFVGCVCVEVRPCGGGVLTLKCKKYIWLIYKRFQSFDNVVVVVKVAALPPQTRNSSNGPHTVA